MNKNKNLLERHQVSGGYRIPLDILHYKLEQIKLNKSERIEKNIEKEEKSLLKSDIMMKIANISEVPNTLTYEMLGNDPLCKKSRSEIADEIIKDIEKKLEKIQKSKQNIQQKYLEKKKINYEKNYKNDENDFIIYEGNERKQYANHEISSLQVANLGNEANHVKLRNLEQQYNEKKSKCNKIYNKTTTKKNFDYKRRDNDFKSNKKLIYETKKEYLDRYNNYLSEKKDLSKIHTRKKFNNQEDFDRYQPTSPNPKRSKSHNNSPSKSSISKKLRFQESKNKYDWLSHFFKKVENADYEKGPLKTDISKNMIRYTEILESFSLKAFNVNNEINEFTTKLANRMTFDELIEFYKSRQKTKKSLKIENTSLLSDKELKIMENIFKEVDIHNDFVVSRIQLLTKLRNDPHIEIILKNNAVYLPGITKCLTLETVLMQIEQEGKMKKNEYISWKQFEDYFTGHKVKNNELYNTMRNLKIKNNMKLKGDDQNIIDLDKIIKDFLFKIYMRQNKKKDSHGDDTPFVNTFIFIEDIRGEKEFHNIQKEIGRKKAENFFLKNENISEVLNRIENEAGQYINWNDFIDFFTRRGRPQYLSRNDEEKYNNLQNFYKSPNVEDLEDEYF